MKEIFTYFDASADAVGQGNIIRLWHNSWLGHGWRPTMLTPRTLTEKPHFARMAAARKRVEEFVADPLERIRIHRLLALWVAGGGVFCEYDVLCGSDRLQLIDGHIDVLHSAGVPLFLLPKSVLNGVLEQVENLDRFRHADEMLVDAIGEIAHYGVTASLVCRDIGTLGWEKAATVHFSDAGIKQHFGRRMAKHAAVDCCGRVFCAG